MSITTRPLRFAYAAIRNLTAHVDLRARLLRISPVHAMCAMSATDLRAIARHGEPANAPQGSNS
eukprot:11083151-Heterocapsa_arctica.AAC.1